VLLWRSDDQLVRCFDQPADQIAKAAGGAGGATPALESHDLKFVGGLHPTRLSVSSHSCGIATNDHQS